MATDREYEPPAMTEDERLGRKRFDAYFAFEMGHPEARRSTIRGNTRLEHFGLGSAEHLPKERT